MIDSPERIERVKKLKEEIFGNDLTAEEAAKILEVDKTTIYKYLRTSVLIGYQLGRRWRVPAREITTYKERLLEANRSRAGTVAMPINTLEEENEPLDPADGIIAERVPEEEMSLMKETLIPSNIPF